MSRSRQKYLTCYKQKKIETNRSQQQQQPTIKGGVHHGEVGGSARGESINSGGAAKGEGDSQILGAVRIKSQMP